MAKREEKWDEILGGFRGVEFWNCLYRSMECIEFDNKIKWFQYQVNRLILKTNYVVSIFRPQVMTLCGFCRYRSETILHLLWNCPIVNSFYRNALESVRENAPMYYWPMECVNFIFSMTNRKMAEPYNMFTLYLKYFVWKCKHRGTHPTLPAFRNFFNHEITVIKKAFRTNPRYDRLMLI